MNPNKTRREAGQQQKKLTANYKPRPDVVQAINRAALVRAICSFGFAASRKAVRS
jgi:hypothetical protein